MWADYEYYITTYRLGAPGVIPEELWPFWEKQARETINRKKVEVVTPPECLKDCACAVAEILYEANEAPKPGELISESNAGYSWKAQEARSGNAIKSDVKATVNRYLSGTQLHNDFVFGGVR